MLALSGYGLLGCAVQVAVGAAVPKAVRLLDWPVPGRGHMCHHEAPAALSGTVPGSTEDSECAGMWMWVLRHFNSGQKYSCSPSAGNRTCGKKVSCTQTDLGSLLLSIRLRAGSLTQLSPPSSSRNSCPPATLYVSVILWLQGPPGRRPAESCVRLM